MKDITDVIIIGAGACGLFTAINIAEKAPHMRIHILEKSKEALGKVRISGGGRCNLTNAETNPREFVKNYPRGNRELLGVFSRFSSQDTVRWFSSHGVAIKQEADGRMFPQSNSSQTVIDCFLSLAKKYHIEILYRQNIQSFSYEQELWQVQGSETFLCRHLVVATGSNPKIWQLLAGLGHTIVPPVPSLFTFRRTGRGEQASGGQAIRQPRNATEGASYRQTRAYRSTAYHPLGVQWACGTQAIGLCRENLGRIGVQVCPTNQLVSSNR